MLKLTTEENPPAIMEPMESLAYTKDEIDDAIRSELSGDSDFKSVPFIPMAPEDEDEFHDQTAQKKSFLLIDSNENLRVPSTSFFCKKLHCREKGKIKVVSIFGNTGDGKSHTLNYTFFEGEEVFRTSSAQNSCTIGVWAAMDPTTSVLCLDTEGLLGTTPNENRRMRMLLKILAVSDIIIFRTRSERLHSDMFQFLGMASKAFNSHFNTALQSLELGNPSKSLGPAVIVFHETRNTKPLESSVAASSEDILRERFSSMGLGMDAFSSLRYIGIETGERPTDYIHIKRAVRLEIENTTIRSPREPGVVFKALNSLNKKFSGEISERSINPFPEQYFTCNARCESCGSRCQRSMDHNTNGASHKNSNLCTYRHQFKNKVYLCRACHVNGREVVVSIRSQTNDNSWYGLAKYAISGSVIECPICGEIYRSRQYWYGNKDPEDAAVRTEIVHVWKDSRNPVVSTEIHSAQMVLDGVSYLSETLTSISAPSSKALTDWVADKIAPSYWKPNSEIIHCHACKTNFERSGLQKHHCRSCGEGFCNACSKNQLPVPLRGWDKPVRVCDRCYDDLTKPKDISSRSTGTNSPDSNEGEDPADILARKYGEAFYQTLSSVVSVLDYPKDLIKESARPSYWIPDNEAPICALCALPFGTAEELSEGRLNSDESIGKTNRNTTMRGENRRHHCRSCGQAICEKCSLNRRPVPERGWSSDVRVCDVCFDRVKFD